MKKIQVLSSLLLAMFAGGCVAFEGVNDYYLHGKIVDAQTGKPLVGAKVVGFTYRFDDLPLGGQYLSNQYAYHMENLALYRKRLPDCKFITDQNGEFDIVVGNMFGDLGLFFLEPPHRPPAVLREVTLCVSREGAWRKIVVPLTKSQQSRHTVYERWVELGTVRYDPAATVVTSRPAQKSR